MNKRAEEGLREWRELSVYEWPDIGEPYRVLKEDKYQKLQPVAKSWALFVLIIGFLLAFGVGINIPGGNAGGWYWGGGFLAGYVVAYLLPRFGR